MNNSRTGPRFVSPLFRNSTSSMHFCWSVYMYTLCSLDMLHPSFLMSSEMAYCTGVTTMKASINIIITLYLCLRLFLISGYFSRNFTLRSGRIIILSQMKSQTNLLIRSLLLWQPGPGLQILGRCRRGHQTKLMPNTRLRGIRGREIQVAESPADGLCGP